MMIEREGFGVRTASTAAFIWEPGVEIYEDCIDHLSTRHNASNGNDGILTSMNTGHVWHCTAYDE